MAEGEQGGTGIVLRGYILVADADLSAVLGELENHMALTRAEPGCLEFSVEREGTSGNRFNVYERFIDRQAFEFHQQRVRASRWGVVTANIERHYQVHESCDPSG